MQTAQPVGLAWRHQPPVDQSVYLVIIMTIDVKKTVLNAIAEVLERKDADIPLDASLQDDLDMDSLKRMTLFILLEDEFHRSMQPEEVTGLVTVRNIIDFIGAKLQESAET
jgi:acyl carrier protein